MLNPWVVKTTPDDIEAEPDFSYLPSYSSQFGVSSSAERVLREGKIIDPKETPAQMIERVVNTISGVEARFETPLNEIAQFTDEFGRLLDKGYAVMSTPIMTNAGRYKTKPMAACTVPPVDLRTDLTRVKKVINQFHADGMGTGFSLDEVDDPVKILLYLNDISVDGAKSGREDRPVGNIAIISVRHPSIEQIIHIKRGADQRGEKWKFNISINADYTFMQAAKTGRDYTLFDGRVINAREMLYQIAEAAGNCGDPGLIFLDRMNKDNPTPVVGSYKSTAPCAEVGLTLGESCMFGYLNLGKFIYRNGKTTVDMRALGDATRIMTRALDNALEYSIDYLPHETNKWVMRAKRKIGVGICGLADMLAKLGIPYDSPEGRKQAQEVTVWVNYLSKVASIELARTRGSFGAMSAICGNKHTEEPGFIETKYGRLQTKTVSATDWQKLSRKIQETKLLRNASTTALPPTGRSGMVIDASTGVEPWFTLFDYAGNIQPSVLRTLRNQGLITDKILSEIQKTGKIGHLKNDLPANIRTLFQTALEIAPEGHLGMVASVGQAVDESVSKTVNMPPGSTTDDIVKIYKQAYAKGLKGITVFVAGSRTYQPRDTAK